MGFKEVSIGQSPEQIVFYDDSKRIRRQYESCHYITGNTLGTMGGIYNHMEMLVRYFEKYFHYGIAVS